MQPSGSSLHPTETSCDAKALIARCKPQSDIGTRALPIIDASQLTADAFYHEHVKVGRPTLIGNAMNDWAALRNWRSQQYLLDMTGSISHPITDVLNNEVIKVPLGSFWRGMFERRESAKSAYLIGVVKRNGRLRSLGPLSSDISVPPFMSLLRHQSTKMFAGYDTVCSLHYHPRSEALLCQVIGERRILLFPPEDLPYLQAYPWYSEQFTNSRIQFLHGEEWPNLRAYPELAKTRPYDLVVKPGDVLYIPVYWWHVVQGIETSMCVTQFFRSTYRRRYLSYYGLRSNYLALFRPPFR